MNSKSSTTLAIPFISFHENQGFKLSPEAQQFLSSLPQDRQLGIVSIVGKYRTGKSFFVNRVLLDQKKSGFQVGPTINPCTKGLWLWKKTVPSQTNKNMDIILIDTEGFGGMDQNANHDSRIFLFSLLLSSYFIYNSVGSIDQNAINTLNLIINLAKQIQTKSNSADDQSQFPSFLWVVRDFTLKLVDKNETPITAKEYLENALELQKGSTDATQKKNKIRRLLKQFFQDRDCETMVRPTEAEKDLQKLDQIDNSMLRPQFVSQVKAIRQKVYSHVKSKKINGQNLNGNLLVSLCKGYMEHINKGSLPNVESAWFYVCRSQGLKALRSAQRLLENLLEDLSKNPPKLDEIPLEKARITQIVMNEFKKRAMNSEKGHPDLLDKLVHRIQAELQVFTRRQEQRQRQQERQEMQNSIFDLQKQVRELKWEMKTKQQEWADEKRRLQNEIERLQRFQRQSLQQQGNVQELQKRQEEFLQEKKRLQKEIERVEKESFRYREEMNELLQKQQEWLEEKKQLQEEIERLQTENHRLQEANHKSSKQAQQVEIANSEDWLLEKSYLQNQVAFLKNTMNENKKLHDALLIAFQKSVTNNQDESNEELMQANKNMALTIQKMEEKYRVLEEKYSSLKDVKKVIKHCSSMECSMCRKLVPTEAFEKHLIECNEEEESENVPERMKSISDTITVSLNFRESEDRKKTTAEYVIQVVKNGSKTKSTKKYKDFSQLQKSLISRFPSIKYPESSKFLCDFNYMMGMKKNMAAEQKRKAVQQYLRDLWKIQEVRESSIFKDFFQTKELGKQVQNIKSK